MSRGGRWLLVSYLVCLPCLQLMKKKPKPPPKLVLRNVQMPDAGCKVKAVVAYVKSTANFYVQLASQQNDLQSMMAEVAQYCKGPARKLTESDLQPGTVCCALFPADGQWYRALIIKSDRSELTVSVFFPFFFQFFKLIQNFTVFFLILFFCCR